MTSRIPGFDRRKAIKWLRGCILNIGETDPRNNLPIDEDDNNDVKIFIMNQSFLVATALYRVKSNDYKKVARATKRWITNNQDLIQQNPIRGQHYPILNHSIIPVGFSYLPTVDVFLQLGGAGTNTDPTSVQTNTSPVDDFSTDIEDLSSNRAFLRCMHRIKIQKDFTLARTEYNKVMDNPDKFDGFAILDNSDIQEDGTTRYSAGKTVLQWFVADQLGEPRVQPKIMDVIQFDTGKVGQFFFNVDDEPTQQGTHGNTELTSLTLIADTMLRDFQ